MLGAGYLHNPTSNIELIAENSIDSICSAFAGVLHVPQFTKDFLTGLKRSFRQIWYQAQVSLTIHLHPSCAERQWCAHFSKNLFQLCRGHWTHKCRRKIHPLFREQQWTAAMEIVPFSLLQRWSPTCHLKSVFNSNGTFNVRWWGLERHPMGSSEYSLLFRDWNLGFLELEALLYPAGLQRMRAPLWRPEEKCTPQQYR